MNKNKIEEILKKARLPKEIDESKKQELRRELLNSKHFEKKNFAELLLDKKYIFAGVFVILIAVVILFNLNDRPVTLSELQQQSNSYYSEHVQPASFASYNNELTLYGMNREEVKLKVEQIIDPATENINVKVFDEKGVENLVEIIVKDGRIYRTENPKIKTIGTVSQVAQSKIEVFIIEDSLELPAQLKKLTVRENHINLTHRLPDNGYLVYDKPVKTMNEIPTYTSKPFYQEVPKEIDIDKYFGTNPLKLADEINTSENIKYIGDEIDNQTSETFHLLEIVRDIDENVIRDYRLILNNADSLTEYSFTIDKIDSIQKIHINGDKNLTWVQGDSLQSYQELKTISLEPNSGKIIKVKFAILKGRQKINLSEIRFNGGASLKADTLIFNAKKQGLVLVGKNK